MQYCHFLRSVKIFFCFSVTVVCYKYFPESERDNNYLQLNGNLVKIAVKPKLK